MSKIETPECDKMLAIKDKSQEIGEFLSWLTGQGIELFQFEGEQEEYFPISRSNEALLAGYFGIDLDKVEQEKRAILAGYRKPEPVTTEGEMAKAHALTEQDIADRAWKGASR